MKSSQTLPPGFLGEFRTGPRFNEPIVAMQQKPSYEGFVLTPFACPREGD
jgi:hypothetical protein